MRLIDADALEIDMRKYADNKAYCGHIELANGILKGVGRIDLAPTIAPESLRPQSYWESYETSVYIGLDVLGEPRWAGRKFYRCEKCRTGSAVQSDYCPKCGAWMKEGDHV